MATQTTFPSSLRNHFKEKKSKWLHLYQRCLARLNKISDLQVLPYKGFIEFSVKGAKKKNRVKMKVRFNGLEFTFPRRVRTILISEPHQLDEEMMILFRAAVHTSKSRST